MNTDPWLSNFVSLSAAFEIFSWLPQHFYDRNTWPTLHDYNSLLQQSIKNSEKQSIKFVAQQSSGVFEATYEPRIYLQGEVQTRTQNWHDLFNALIWCTFPTIKAKLNYHQYHALCARNNSKQRSGLENFLTLFDENGLVILSSDNNLLSLIEQKQWQTLFLDCRQQLKETLKCYVIGHSLHEKFLNPYIGMTGHALLFHSDGFDQCDTVTSCFQALSLPSMTSRDLSPFPVLGLPGWHPQNSDPRFYDNNAYFRGPRIAF